MPQANITYNTAYNRDLVSRLNQMEEDMLFQNKHQYHPSPLGYRLSLFHDAQGIANTPNIGRDYSYSSSDSTGKMTGGGANKKFILNGNSPAYPPLDMRASLAISSGGSRRTIGVDGAVSGGSFLGDVKKGFDGVLDSAKKVASTASAIAPIVALGAKAMSGTGRAPRGRPAKGHAGRTQTKVKGGNFLKGLASLAKKVAPIALPLLMGLGRKASMVDKKKAITDALVGGNFWDGFKKGFSDVADLATKIAPIALPLMTGLGKKQYGGSFNFGKFLASKRMVGSKKDACGRSSGTRDFNMPCSEAKAKVGGNILDDAIEATKPLVRKGKKAVKEAIKENAPKATTALKKLADKAITKVVGGGRSARASIVKKIMAEKGMKMIEASKYVKEHGLYKK